MAAISPLSTESLAKRTTSINDAIARVTSAATAYAEITKKGLDDDGGSSSRNNSNITPTAEATAQGQARIQAQEALTVQARRLLAEVQGPMGAIFDLLGTTCRLAALRCLLEVGVFAALPADGTALTVDALLARLPPRDVGRHHEQGGEGGGGGKIEKELLVRLLRNAAVPGWGPLVEVGEETYALDVSTSTVRGNSSSLAAGGVVGAPAPGAGAMLMTSPHATAVLKQMFDESIPALVALPGFFRENGWVVPREPRNCPYTYAHRTGGRVMWDHIALFPERQANCNAAMRAESFDGVWGVGLYPFCERLSSSSYPSSSSSSGGGEEGRVLVVDVGGGAGHTSRKIRELCGGLKGTVVLQDREEVVVDAEDVEGVLKMAHNFFEEQPVKGEYLFLTHLHTYTHTHTHSLIPVPRPFILLIDHPFHTSIRKPPPLPRRDQKENHDTELLQQAHISTIFAGSSTTGPTTHAWPSSSTSPPPWTAPSPHASSLPNRSSLPGVSASRVPSSTWS